MRIAILWADNLIAEALASLLQHRGNFDVVGASATAHECLSIVKESGAEVVLAQGSLIRSGVRDMLEGARLLGGFGLVVVDDGGENEEGQTPGEPVALTIPSEELFDRIREVAPTRDLPHLMRSRSRSKLGLSARELEVAQLVARGMSNRRISEVTGLQEQSVKNLVSVIIRRLNCENRTQVALKLMSV